MIHSLRQRHRQTVIALGVLLPVAFILGIAVRKPIPVMAEAPAGLAGSGQNFTVIEWQRPDLFKKSPVQTRVLRANGGGLALSLVAARDFVQPDLLVYVVPGSAVVTDALPNSAVLLGEASSPALPLPDALAATNGVIILYSLANGEIVDVSQPVQFNRIVSSTNFSGGRAVPVRVGWKVRGNSSVIPSPDASLGDGDGAARRPYLDHL